MFRKLLSGLFIFGLLFGACTSAVTRSPESNTGVSPVSSATSTPVLVLTDGFGREVRLTKAAQRVVSLAPSLTEILFAVGAGGQVVGRDDFSDYPADARSVASIGSTYQTLNTETILALKPDLVVAAGINTPEQVKALEDVGLTVYYFSNPTDFPAMYGDLLTMGKLTGHEQEAAALVVSLQKRVEVVEQKVANLTEKPSVFYEIDAMQDPAKPWTTGPGTFMDTMIGMAGGVNIGAVLEEPWAQISLEELIRQDPQIIILGDAKWGATPESVAQRPGWDGLTAVKTGAIFTFDDDLASRPGPRLVDGLETLFDILHVQFTPIQ